MTEPSLAAELDRRVGRITVVSILGYVIVVVGVFAVLAELAVRESAENAADVIQSLIGLYADPEGTPTGVAPAMLAEQLIGMGEPFAITRTTRDGSGTPRVYYLSPTMPAKPLEGLSGASAPTDARRALVNAIAERARWRFRIHHRHVVNEMGDFDIYVVGNRVPSLAATGFLTATGVLLLPLVVLLARKGARRAIYAALQPLDRVTAETRRIDPADLSRRLSAPTGQAEITVLADGINRMLDRVETAHRSLQSFTGDASHELRTPLTHIKARADWCLTGQRDQEEIREAFSAIVREIDRTTNMINDLLTIAKGENHQLAISKDTFNLDEVTAEVEEIANAMATGRTLRITRRVTSSLTAIGDPNRTREILLNLVTNAVRYTNDGSITIATRKDDGMVGVEVSDTGPGISPDCLPHIFDRFYRIDESRSREYGGAGLGLTIAKVLAELQGGTIDVHSTLGQGSTFVVWLPGATASGPDQEQ